MVIYKKKVMLCNISRPNEPDTSTQPTPWVSPKSVSTTSKNDETATNDVEYQELH